MDVIYLKYIFFFGSDYFSGFWENFEHENFINSWAIKQHILINFYIVKITVKNQIILLTKNEICKALSISKSNIPTVVHKATCRRNNKKLPNANFLKQNKGNLSQILFKQRNIKSVILNYVNYSCTACKRWYWSLEAWKIWLRRLWEEQVY